jgi:ribose/xylose/arabinose/galactoside ABC-type transport system permease subunit
MRHALAILLGSKLRPFTIMTGAIIVLALVDRGTGYFFSVATAFSVLQLFATLSLVALGLGLSMMVREFDLSVAGIMGLAGCIAVLTGVENPWLGLVCGVAAGLISGGVEGLIMTRLGISSVGVTLGGLLTLQGMTYVLTGNRTITYPNLDVSLALSTSIHGLLSVRSALALAVFLAVAFVMAFTRIGRDVIATGSDRRASMVAGIKTDRVVVGVFMASGAFSALGGVLLTYSLGAASPVGLADVLVPAAAAAIIGGVSLGGGKGHPLGIAAGVLTLCILRSGFNAIGVPPHVHEIVTGAILMVIAVVDAPDLIRELTKWKLRRAERRAEHAEHAGPPRGVRADTVAGQ